MTDICYNRRDLNALTGDDVGAPATVSIGSDRYAHTVTEVKLDREGKTLAIEVQADRWIGPSLFAPDPSGEKLIFTRRTDGIFKVKGTTNGFRLTVGYRVSYLDPSF